MIRQGSTASQYGGAGHGNGGSYGRYVAPMIAFTKPMVSINFGAFDLHHCPADALPANTVTTPMQQYVMHPCHVTSRSVASRACRIESYGMHRLMAWV